MQSAEFLFIEIIAGDVCFVNLFRSILPVGGGG